MGNNDGWDVGKFTSEVVGKDEDVCEGSDDGSGDDVIDNYQDRIIGLTEEQAIAEASRCMSCGMCFE